MTPAGERAGAGPGALRRFRRRPDRFAVLGAAAVLAAAAEPAGAVAAAISMALIALGLSQDLNLTMTPCEAVHGETSCSSIGDFAKHGWVLVRTLRH